MTTESIVFLIFLVAVDAAFSAPRTLQPLHLSPAPGFVLPAECRENYFPQLVDHFSFVATPTGDQATFNQRYIVCGQSWWDPNGPVFFYSGNEANVELYLNHTGLMWENSRAFKALMVFAEHRYFGKTVLPEKYGLRFLSSLQAIEDYAKLIRFLRESLPVPDSSAVIGFGGSYGGMLAAWLRMKHPESIDGAIAASAPIAAFLGLSPAFESGGYAQIITEDADPECATVIRASWRQVVKLSETPAGRQSLASELRLCEVPKTSAAALGALAWGFDSISYLAMSDFPYPSSYLTNGLCELPAWPIEVGCIRAKEETSPIAALREMAAVFLNCTGRLKCFELGQSVNNETTEVGNLWYFLSCTEMLIPFSTDGKTDMFWNAPFDQAQVSNDCFKTFGVRPRPFEPVARFGGHKALRTATNIVFSNGSLDPWRAGGIVTPIPSSPSIVVVLVEKGAHHLDLMFSHPKDPASVTTARRTEVDNIAKWVKQASLRV